MLEVKSSSPFSRRRWNRLRELAFPLDALKFAAESPLLWNAPRGDGRPIMLLPGYFASEYSMMPLKAFLKHLGYEPHHWDLGRNLGDVDAYAENLAHRIEVKFTEPVTLIGWSLGGAISRRLARALPVKVREVITMGTPVGGGSREDKAEKINASGRLEVAMHCRNLIPVPQPLTVIYSENDGVVPSRIAIDRYNDHARHVQVDTTHMAMGVSAKIWRIIADILAEEK